MDSDKAVGQVACQFFESDLWVGWSLAPELCGQRNGYQFVRKCVDEIRRMKSFTGTVKLRVSARNIRAIKAYQKAGFRYLETIQDEVAYTNHIEDFWVMEENNMD
jgi:ribosomal-protein-alanine N-acetyltransferase